MTVSSGSGKLSLFEQTSALNFSEIVIDSLLSAPRSAVISDINMDGQLDYCAASSSDDMVYAYLATTGGMSYNKTLMCNDCDNAYSIASGDFDGNNYNDIVSAKSPT